MNVARFLNIIFGQCFVIFAICAWVFANSKSAESAPTFDHDVKQLLDSYLLWGAVVLMAVSARAKDWIVSVQMSNPKAPMIGYIIALAVREAAVILSFVISFTGRSLTPVIYFVVVGVALNISEWNKLPSDNMSKS